MKKLVYLIIAMLVLGLIISGCLPVVPPAEKDEISSLTKQKLDPEPGTDFNGAHFNLNLIGKKADWSDGESFDNPNRHTIFVPEDTTGYETPNGKPGITIWMTQCPPLALDCDFAVLDGDAFGDGEASFQLAPGYYEVYIAAKGKPKNKDTEITGWVWGDNTATFYYELGTVKVRHSKKPVWKDVTKELFMIGSEWIFDYIRDLSLSPEDQDKAYFWQLVNGGKLIQVRFYEVSELP